MNPKSRQSAKDKCGVKMWNDDTVRAPGGRGVPPKIFVIFFTVLKGERITGYVSRCERGEDRGLGWCDDPN
eukprot:SAG11_NODE_874_length_6773_cov_4.639114_8_plen_71_part_00